MDNSRFKHFLIPQKDLAAESLVLGPRLQTIFKSYDDGLLNTPQMLFLVIATVCEHRKSGDWWMKGASGLEFSNEKPTRAFALAVEALNFAHRQGKVESADTTFISAKRSHVQAIESLSDFFSRYRLKKLPQAIERVLWLWSSRKASLYLSETPVTPQTMLEMQSRGERVVTCSREAFLNGKMVDGKRDALEFLLHDLTHADLFFSETHNEQIQFFSVLKSVLEKPVVDSDPQFQAALEYIMSDMNSNHAHLQLSLRAAVIDRERRKHQLASHEKLAPAIELQLSQSWGGLF